MGANGGFPVDFPVRPRACPPWQPRSSQSGARSTQPEPSLRLPQLPVFIHFANPNIVMSDSAASGQVNGTRASRKVFSWSVLRGPVAGLSECNRTETSPIAGSTSLSVPGRGAEIRCALIGAEDRR